VGIQHLSSTPKTQQNECYRHWHDGAQIWLGLGLVNGAAEQRVAVFGRWSACVQGAYKARIGSFASKKSHVRKLSFCYQPLFPYVVRKLPPRLANFDVEPETGHKSMI